jgi:general secretion pathway protein F
MEYVYKVLDKRGEEIRGFIIATSIDEAKKKLKEEGFIIIDVKEKETEFISKKIKDEDAYRTFNQLSLLLKSGLSVDYSLSICIDSFEKKVIKNLLETILKSIKAGKTVSQAFLETGFFSPLVISIIKVGEETGKLAKTFENLANYFDFRIKFKTDIKNAMLYPTFLIFASFVALIGIFKIIIPKFFSVFGEDISALPFTARILYEISETLNLKNFFAFLLFLILFFTFTKIQKLKFIFSKLFSYLIYFPFLKNIFLNLELSRFCYSMTTMLQNGVEFIIALTYSTEIIQNKLIQKELELTIPKIKEGKSITKAFDEVLFLPAFVKGTIKVAEESGNLAEVFFQLYQHFEEGFKTAIKRLLTIVEPLIITIMGIIIGVIVLSLILTIMSVSNIKI